MLIIKALLLVFENLFGRLRCEQINDLIPFYDLISSVVNVERLNGLSQQKMLNC